MLVNYRLAVKEEPLDWGGKNPLIMDSYLEICRQIEIMRQHNARFEREFISLTNLIVSLGGIIDLKKEAIESDWKLFINEINVKIPEDKIEIIRKHPSVLYLKRI